MTMSPRVTTADAHLRPLHAEQSRLEARNRRKAAWGRWGPYLSERQWGTVREDYSATGEAWEAFPHDHARSRAYRWGEDGIAGISDKQQRLCLALALWNGRDPILKERLFGLTNAEGNHGEDVKELYYYLDATPTHSYLKMLYKYPQAEFPYARLVEENRCRGKDQPEYELLDTGVFDEDRYFDVFVEYAKAGVDDILMLITAHNRGTEDAPLHLLPQLWFRNTWAWGYDPARPQLSADERGCVVVEHSRLKGYHWHLDGDPDLLFCDNDTNANRLYGERQPGYFKDGLHDCVVAGNRHAVNPGQNGTKVAGHYAFDVSAGGQAVVRLRLVKGQNAEPFADFDEIMQQRRQEADAFYADIQSDLPDAEARMIQRQALAGMIWSQQFYYYDVPQWLKGDPAMPPPRRRGGMGAITNGFT
jgi:hypothetical protein